ncbi:MAG: TlpA family protein disulfide reductase [Aestuariibacter sp.]
MLNWYRSWWKYAIQVLLFVAVFMIVDGYQTRGMLGPENDIPQLQQALVSLEGDVHPLVQPDRRTLVYFFAPWCRICALSIGSLNKLQDPSLDVVAVALDYQNIESVKAFVNEHQLRKLVLLGTQETRQQFKVPGYPSYYLFDEQGNVVAKSFGLNTSFGIKIKDWLTR